MIIALIVITIILFIMCCYLTYVFIKNDKFLKTEIKLLKQQNNELNHKHDENDIRSRYDALTQTRYGQLNVRNISFENLPSATNIAAIRKKEIK